MQSVVALGPLPQRCIMCPHEEFLDCTFWGSGRLDRVATYSSPTNRTTTIGTIARNESAPYIVGGFVEFRFAQRFRG
jgi:hypothetical protein